MFEGHKFTSQQTIIADLQERIVIFVKYKCSEH